MPASTARRGALALVLAALVLFVLGSLEMARGATHEVAIADFAFAPATLTIAAGDTVTWSNEDAVAHTATSTTGAFDSGDLGQGESFSFTFATPGTYDYLCTPHPTMTGQIVVQAAAAAPTAAPTAAPGGVPDVAMAMDRGWPFVLLGTLGVGAALLLLGHRLTGRRR
jgi:plastocyanin